MYVFHEHKYIIAGYTWEQGVARWGLSRQGRIRRGDEKVLPEIVSGIDGWRMVKCGK